MNKKLERLLLVFLILQPFLDVIATTKYSIVNIAIRGIFLIFISFYLLINKKNIIPLILLLLIYLISFSINIYLKRDLISFISSTMKLYYLPITILFFINIRSNINNQTLTYILSIYIGLFLISYIFGFGYNNYKVSDGKSGFRGIFNSINEISAIIIGLLPISLDYLKSNKKYIISILLIITTFLVALLTGTKVLMIGLFIVIIFTYFKLFINKFKKMTKLTKILIIVFAILLLILTIYLITFTRFYQNMIIQKNFFKANNLFSLYFIDKVIFNNRLTFLQDNFILYINQDIIQKLFGIGYNNGIIKLVEIDILDILFRFGIFGFVSFIIPMIYILKKIKLTRVGIFSIGMLLFISLTSGHVLLNPNVSIYFGYIIMTCYKH